MVHFYFFNCSQIFNAASIDKLQKIFFTKVNRIITNLCSSYIVGGDFTNRRQEIDYPNRRLDTEQKVNDPIVTTEVSLGSENGVLIMDAKNENRPTSFFAQPGILAGEFI